jgi:hypothetical protein
MNQINPNAMTPDEVKSYRSTANKALYVAQYLANVHGDKRYFQAIAKYFIATEDSLQPAVIDIRDFVVNGSDKIASDVFAYCAQQYERNSNLINAWLNR